MLYLVCENGPKFRFYHVLLPLKLEQSRHGGLARGDQKGLHNRPVGQAKTTRQPKEMASNQSIGQTVLDKCPRHIFFSS